MSEVIWEANTDYVMEDAGDVCTIAGRTFTKVNAGKALVAVFYNTAGYTGPLLVSTDPNAVTYYAYGSTFGYLTTIEYLGLTWYVSNNEYAMGGNNTPSGYAKYIGMYESIVAAAQALLDIAEVRIHIDSKYLIQDGTTLYTVVNGELEAIESTELTAAFFDVNGMEEPPTSEQLLSLNNPKVFAWNKDEPPELSAVITATPYPQTLYSPDYDMTDATILGIEKVIAVASDDVTFSVSFDSGETWKYYTGTDWATLSEETSGMTAETIMAVPTDKWGEVATTGHYMVRATLPGVESTLESFVVDYINR